MQRREAFKNLYRLFSNALETLIVTAMFGYLWIAALNYHMPVRFLSTGNYLMIAIYLVLATLFINAFGGYKIGIQRISIVSMAQAIAISMNNALMVVITILMARDKTSIFYYTGRYILLSIVQAVLMVVMCFALTKLFRLIFPPYNMLLINGEHDNTLMTKMNLRDDKYHITEEVSYTLGREAIRRKLEGFDAVVINDVPAKERNELLKLCFDERIRVYFTPKISDILVKNCDEVNIFDTPLYLCKNQYLSPFQAAIKRAGDIIISLTGIIITSPIMIIAAILIHAYDKGPVFYKQTRCTIGDKQYKILKFRSMIVNAEADGRARMAQEHDDRITPIGKIIRATRIDELPQFFNILKGDMSVVGPRPERPELIEKYVREVPEFAYRTRVKAGLTGYAQVYGKYNTTSYDKLKLDMIYVEKCSVLLDIQLILMTLRVIFTKDSTEGVEQGQMDVSHSNDK